MEAALGVKIGGSSSAGRKPGGASGCALPGPRRGSSAGGSGSGRSLRQMVWFGPNRCQVSGVTMVAGSVRDPDQARWGGRTRR